MKHWPLHTYRESRKFSFLLLDERGLSVLEVSNQQLDKKLRLVNRDKLPEGAEVIPNHQLLRIRSCRGTRTLVARMHGNRQRKFRLRSVEARNNLLMELRKHPSVTHVKAAAEDERGKTGTRLGMGLLAGVLLLSGIPAIFSYLGLVIVALVAYSTWRPHQKTAVDEVLFS